MQVVSIISTKGGVGKTTTAANLGGLAADAGLRVLLLDLDVQPTLSSYYELAHRAPGGIYELLAFNERDLGQLVSRTVVAGLDLVLSNDHRGELNTLLLHAPDGRLRLRHLLPALAPLYDLVLIDTQGARSVLLEMAVLASDAVARRHCAVPAPGHRTAAAALAHQPRPPGVRQRTADPAGLARPVPGQRRHPRARHRRAGHRSVSTCRNARPAGASGRAPPAARQSRPCRARHDARARQRVVPAMAGPTGSSIRPPAATS